jgi:hypothetical protein
VREAEPLQIISDLFDDEITVSPCVTLVPSLHMRLGGVHFPSLDILSLPPIQLVLLGISQLCVLCVLYVEVSFSAIWGPC